MSVLFAVGMMIGAFDETAVSTHDPSTCPRHAAHQAAASPEKGDHHRQVDLRHDAATGIAHGDSVHHFELAPRGGRIRLEVTDPKDAAGRDRIRAHLATIARDFAQGRFDLPTRIHDRTPPGVESMQRLKSAIRYRYVPTPRGGRVEIRTESAEALAAIHGFLRFQIDEHRTEDRSF
jgi:hypothetical protein